MSLDRMPIFVWGELAMALTVVFALPALTLASFICPFAVFYSVTNILIQQGRIPLTRMLAPGAMGESEQVGNEKTTEGQAENRRVVVRVLQNKAIAGAL